MEKVTKLFFSESDVRQIITKHINLLGYDVVGDLELVTRSKDDIPKGAVGDVLGVHATVEKKSGKNND